LSSRTRAPTRRASFAFAALTPCCAAIFAVASGSARGGEKFAKIFAKFVFILLFILSDFAYYSTN
jgi:hypothetical protein